MINERKFQVLKSSNPILTHNSTFRWKRSCEACRGVETYFGSLLPVFFFFLSSIGLAAGRTDVRSSFALNPAWVEAITFWLNGSRVNESKLKRRVISSWRNRRAAIRYERRGVPAKFGINNFRGRVNNFREPIVVPNISASRFDRNGEKLAGKQSIPFELNFYDVFLFKLSPAEYYWIGKKIISVF